MYPYCTPFERKQVNILCQLSINTATGVVNSAFITGKILGRNVALDRFAISVRTSASSCQRHFAQLSLSMFKAATCACSMERFAQPHQSVCLLVSLQQGTRVLQVGGAICDGRSGRSNSFRRPFVGNFEPQVDPSLGSNHHLVRLLRSDPSQLHRLCSSVTPRDHPSLHRLRPESSRSRLGLSQLHHQGILSSVLESQGGYDVFCSPYAIISLSVCSKMSVDLSFRNFYV